MIPDEHLLTVDQVLKKLKQAIEKKKPFSLVRVGDGENIILAQNSVMTMPEVMEEKWARNANKDRDNKGVTLPNITLRDQMVDAIKKASIVGIPFYKNDPILTEDRLKRPLTDRVFKHFDMTPKMCCHTFVNRVFAQRNDFWKALQGKRILIITKDKWSDKVTETLRKKPYNLNVTMSTTFHHHDQMEDALKFIEENKDNYDIALISCGVNALILAQKVAETGNIGIDFGKSLMYIVQKKAGLNHFSRGANKGLIP